MAAALRHTNEQENQIIQPSKTQGANQVFEKLLRQTIGRELPSNAIIQKQIPTSNGIQASIVGKPNGMPRAVYKFANSPQAAVSLLNHARTLKAHERLFEAGELGFQFPTIYALYQNNMTVGLIESVLLGVSLQEYIQNKGSQRLPQIMMDISTKLSGFHKPQQLIINVVDQEIDSMVHEPIDLIEQRLGKLNQKLIGRKLDNLRHELAEALSWQQLSFAPTHGNLHPSNIILDPITHKMIGLINWEAAEQNAYPAVDFFYLVLSAIAQIDKKELGHTVLQALKMPRRFHSEIYSLADQNRPDTAGNSDRIVILLAWLQHLKISLSENEANNKNFFWQHKNISHVLSRL